EHIGRQAPPFPIGDRHAALVGGAGGADDLLARNARRDERRANEPPRHRARREEITLGRARDFAGGDQADDDDEKRRRDDDNNVGERKLELITGHDGLWMRSRNARRPSLSNGRDRFSWQEAAAQAALPRFEAAESLGERASTRQAAEARLDIRHLLQVAMSQ